MVSALGEAEELRPLSLHYALGLVVLMAETRLRIEALLSAHNDAGATGLVRDLLTLLPPRRARPTRPALHRLTEGRSATSA